MNCILLLTAILACLAVATTTIQATTFADSANSNVEELAELVCKTTRGTDHLLGKLATWNEIVDFLGEVSSQHKLYDCSRKYLGALTELINVVETANDDVCGEEKLALIEDFHRRYVSKVGKYVKERKSGNDAPKMAKLFFMSYVSEISIKCETAALEALSSRQDHSTVNESELKAVESLRAFTDSLGITSLSSEGYDGTYLLWNMLDSLGVADNEKFAKYLSVTANVRINVQLKEVRKLVGLHAICQYKLKPVYSRTILPVLRLLDMGYYPTNQLADKFINEPTSRSLFYITQICETLEPIAFYSNPELSENQVVALTKEEAAQLEAPKIPGLEDLVKSNPVKAKVAPTSFKVEELSEESAVHVETIKATVLARSKIISRILKLMWSQAKDKLKSFKLFHRGQNQKLEAVGVEHLEQVDVHQIADTEEDGEDGVKRRKRNVVLRALLKAVEAFFYFWYLWIYYICKIAIFIIPTLIWVVPAIFGSKRGRQELYDIWVLDDPIGGAIENFIDNRRLKNKLIGPPKPQTDE